MDAFLVFVVACFASGFIGGVIGQRKGSSYYVWFLVSLFVPVLGPVAALLYRHETDVPLRLCPNCGDAVRVHDAMCMRCGGDLEYPQESEIIEPDASLRVRARL
jgi:ribosomal protein L32